MKKFNLFLISIILFAMGCKSKSSAVATISETNIRVLNDDLGWCWFQDERAIIDGNQILFSGVTSTGEISVSSYNIETEERQVVVMNGETFETDDHNTGALLLRPDGKYLIVYAGHGNEPKMRYRISVKPGSIDQWEPEMIAETGGNTTYSNVYRLANTGKTYNFHRGIENNPNYMVSNDNGNSWDYGGQLFAFRGRPYLKYASNNKDRIHFITTEEHPRHYNNSIYHGFVQDGYVKKSDGSHLSRLSTNETTDLKPQDFTLVFDGNSETRKEVAWTSDIELDKDNNPYITFSVTQDPIPLGETTNTEEGGFDNRYHYARWDGEQWNEFEIAYAGTRLYAGENEYTGLITLHPDDPNVVYISTNVNPETGNAFIDGGKNHEIFRGTTADGGANWNWIAITKNSAEDNIRPIVVSNNEYEGVLWLNGRYTTYKNYDLKVLGVINKK